MSVVDLEALAVFAKTQPGLVTAVDVTFASPYLIQPIKLGLDISIHSWLVNNERNIPSFIFLNFMQYKVHGRSCRLDRWLSLFCYF